MRAFQTPAGALFVDAGNLIQESSDFGFEDMRYGVGGGLRYNLPSTPCDSSMVLILPEAWRSSRSLPFCHRSRLLERFP